MSAIPSKAARAAMRLDEGLIVDLFAGGGGASTGIEAATGAIVDIAVNHDEVAIAVHRANHPKTEHFPASVWEVDPRSVTKGRRVRLLWASPDCKHFSNAKGGKPREKGIRSLAWVVRDWARDVRPDVICLENVMEFLKWGPLDENDEPIKEREGETFDQWFGALVLLGYKVEYRVLDSSLYGAPTKRRRLFLIARCDGKPIVWPEPTHGPGLLPVHTAAECIDWSVPVYSIFLSKEEGKRYGVKRPLADNTLARVAHGINRFVRKSASPFIVPVNHGGGPDRCESIDDPLSTVTAARRGHALAVPMLVQTGYGERDGQTPRALDIHAPMGTIVGCGVKQALCAAFLAKHYGGEVGIPLTQPFSTITTQDHHGLVAANLVKLYGTSDGADMQDPMPTVTSGGNHIGEVRAFLTSYFGSEADIGQPMGAPLRTITTRDRFGLVMVKGVAYQITDIGLRMLEPHELLRAQFGRFAAGYDLSEAKIRKGHRAGQPSKKDQVRLIGNSVCPEMAEAIIRANNPVGIRRAA